MRAHEPCNLHVMRRPSDNNARNIYLAQLATRFCHEILTIRFFFPIQFPRLPKIFQTQRREIWTTRKPPRSSAILRVKSLKKIIKEIPKLCQISFETCSEFDNLVKRNFTAGFRESLERGTFNLQIHREFSRGKNFSTFPDTFRLTVFSRKTSIFTFPLVTIRQWCTKRFLRNSIQIQEISKIEASRFETSSNSLLYGFLVRRN